MLMKQDLTLRGWSDRLIRELLGNPDEILRRRGGGQIYQYDERRVKKAEKRVAFRRWQEKKARPAVGRKRKSLPERFPEWRNAIPAAAEAMFNLNRYAKYGSCSDPNRDEIYSLKNGLIEAFYVQNLATEVYQHIVSVPEQECFGCGGSGIWESWYTDAAGECRRCDGTGIYREAHDLIFVVFRFQIGGKAYSWHQPADLVKFAPQFTSEPRRNDLEKEERSLSMNRRTFADAKRLVRYVVEAWRAESGSQSSASGAAGGEVMIVVS
jgi:hypothetical protein